mmetsp:Transcript_31642/g.79677  ORF Transcript_31642/g.79677 Transcript_31642/m.79677 type:complete len:265 (+) Transcript_31642:668-1462(+)
MILRAYRSTVHARLSPSKTARPSASDSRRPGAEAATDWASEVLWTLCSRDEKYSRAAWARAMQRVSALSWDAASAAHSSMKTVCEKVPSPSIASVWRGSSSPLPRGGSRLRRTPPPEPFGEKHTSSRGPPVSLAPSPGSPRRSGCAFDGLLTIVDSRARGPENTSARPVAEPEAGAGGPGTGPSPALLVGGVSQQLRACAWPLPRCGMSGRVAPASWAEPLSLLRENSPRILPPAPPFTATRMCDCSTRPCCDQVAGEAGVCLQ